ncbi:Crp/Fnr family transcriptional regulator [Cytophagaceae bacterium YF14B1]|uniref:Crp/Fnr family transcriptional regulator n=1 Tax=Xanthocytophaga flava TaxID=3048013 RepID=A0AAE3R0D1_9BACT|nr:Crp/Fnr family transcriptional regulator [Xanthocytophaga flavus]MDJ1486024.1 Crp/Fnr family transcriptional regulator [Xanthocytophaga flavus]
MSKTTFEPLFYTLELIQKISPQEKEIICQNIEYRKIKESEILLQEGAIAKELFFICKGVLKLANVSEKGNEVVRYFLDEGQFCSNLKSFNENHVSNYRIQASCETEIIVFKRDKLFFLYQAIPYFKELLGRICQRALFDNIHIRNAYLGEDATARYQKFILQQSSIALRVSLRDIAAYLGITQQSLSRIRKNIN